MQVQQEEKRVRCKKHLQLQRTDNAASWQGLLSRGQGLPHHPLLNTGMDPNVVDTYLGSMYRSTTEFHIYSGHVPGAAKTSKRGHINFIRVLANVNHEFHKPRESVWEGLLVQLDAKTNWQRKWRLCNSPSV